SAFKILQEIGVAECEQHFTPKVYGTYALAQALQDHSLDFCLVFSSLSAVLGGLGFSAYAAANLFLDAFVASQRDSSTPWISVNWDTWLLSEQSQNSVGGSISAFSMNAEEGCQAVLRVLSSQLSHLIHSTGDLHARLRQWVLRSPTPGTSQTPA